MNLEIVHTIEKKGYTMYFYPENIIYVKLDGKVLICLEKMIELKDDALQYYKEQNFRTIIDFRDAGGMFSEEAKHFVATDPEFNKYRECEALIATSYVSSLMFGVYLRIFKPKTITRAFSNLEDAYQWVSTFKLK